MFRAILSPVVNHCRKTHSALFDFQLKKTIKYSSILFVLIVAGMFVSAQGKKYDYGISIGGKSVGVLSVKHKSSSDSVVLDVNSAISTRMIFMFTAIAAETAIFKNGRLIYSQITRRINKGRQTTMTTRDMGSVYHSQKKGEAVRISESPIFHNMSSLYLIEPLNFKHVYSDMFQEFLKIIIIAPHHYKIILPDGNYNEYYYGDGICKRIRVHHTLFTAQMDLKSVNHL